MTAPARIPPGPPTIQRWKAMRWKRWEMKSPALRGRFIGSPQLDGGDVIAAHCSR